MERPFQSLDRLARLLAGREPDWRTLRLLRLVLIELEASAHVSGEDVDKMLAKMADGFGGNLRLALMHRETRCSVLQARTARL